MENMENMQQQDIIELATEANGVILEKDKEISKLKRELARSKMYQTVEEEVEDPYYGYKPGEMLDCNGKSDLDIIKHSLGSRQYRLDNGGSDEYGEDGDLVAGFLKQCIDDADGDNAKFINLYQARLPRDNKFY